MSGVKEDSCISPREGAGEENGVGISHFSSRELSLPGSLLILFSFTWPKMNTSLAGERSGPLFSVASPQPRILCPGAKNAWPWVV